MSGVLITRAAPGAQATAARVAALGHVPVMSPALVVEPVAVEVDLRGVQALLFTSAAGVRAFGPRDLPALAVGEGAAEAARAAGYADVRSADGAARDLVDLVKASLAPGGGRIVHVSGEDFATDVAHDLAAAGYAAERVIAYRARPAASLSPAAIDLLTGDSAGDFVAFHSARGAESFCRLVNAAGLRAQAARLKALCLSARIAEAVLIDFARVCVASAPRENALMTLLEQAAANRA